VTGPATGKKISKSEYIEAGTVGKSWFRKWREERGAEEVRGDTVRLREGRISRRQILGVSRQILPSACWHLLRAHTTNCGV